MVGVFELPGLSVLSWWLLCTLTLARGFETHAIPSPRPGGRWLAALGPWHKIGLLTCGMGSARGFLEPVWQPAAPEDSEGSSLAIDPQAAFRGI